LEEHTTFILYPEDGSSKFVRNTDVFSGSLHSNVDTNVITIYTLFITA
jgi:hypothetical protein